MMRKFLLAVVAGLMLAAPGAYAADNSLDPQLRERARRAVDAGLHYLRGKQAADGSVARSVGITALSLRAFLESHRGYSESDGAFITRQIEWEFDETEAALFSADDDAVRLLTIHGS